MTPWAYVPAVHDIDRSAAYYRDVLGFSVTWEEAPDWRLVQRDGVRLMLGGCPDDVPAAEIGSHNWFGYVETADVDALRADILARGGDCSTPKDQHYGMREIVGTAIDGHRIMFGQQLNRGP